MQCAFITYRSTIGALRAYQSVSASSGSYMDQQKRENRRHDMNIKDMHPHLSVVALYTKCATSRHNNSVPDRKSTCFGALEPSCWLCTP
jgi:hypothetical protein